MPRVLIFGDMSEAHRVVAKVDQPTPNRWGIVWELLLYVPVTVVLTWPMVLRPATGLTAPITVGDPYLNLWILGWDLRTLTVHPAALFTGRIFDANIFYPATNTLAYSDSFLPQAVVLWPLYALTHNVTLCYNVLLFSSFLASAIAMHILVRSLTGSRWSAWMAGLVWGFWPYHFAHLRQLQLQALYFLPLAFFFLHRLAAGGRRWDALGLGIAAALQTASAAYYGVMTALALAVTSLVLIASGSVGDRGRFVRRLGLAGAIGALFVAPVAWPYWRLQHEGFVRTLYEAAEHGAVLKSYLWASEGNILYRYLGLSSGPVATDTFERQLFPGLTVIVLAGLGLARARRRPHFPIVVAMAALIGLGCLLSLGPDGIRWLYTPIHRYMFGFQAIRVPARFGILVTFGLAVLAGFGMRDVVSAKVPRFGGPLLLAFVIAEYATVGLPSVPAPPVHTAAGQWLAQAPQPGAVLYLPLYADKQNTPVMVASLEHGRPILNGYSGSRPPLFLALVDIMQQFPSADSLWTLRDLAVRYVVSPRPVSLAAAERDAGHVAPSPLVERVRFNDAVIYELVWTPETEAALPRPESAAPPDPGPMPFHVSESAVYTVTWETAPGGLHVAAGTVTIAAEAEPSSVPPPCSTGPARERAARGMNANPPGGIYRLTAFVQTADWVSRFFEARDCFGTWSDKTLLPVVAEQERREGRRIVEQTENYDPARHVVRIGDQLTLPIPPGARDPLSALFYARTLPLAPGYRVRIPVNENGRNIQVNLHVIGVEPVQYGGKTVEAIRAEPQLTYQVQTRRPIQITLWLSTDARHLPLVMAFAADFGTFRAELASATLK